MNKAISSLSRVQLKIEHLKKFSVTVEMLEKSVGGSITQIQKMRSILEYFPKPKLTKKHIY